MRLRRVTIRWMWIKVVVAFSVLSVVSQSRVKPFKENETPALPHISYPILSYLALDWRSSSC